MYLKDGGEEMVLSDEENDDTRHSCRFFYSNVATTQVSKCKGYACARFWRQPRPAPARPVFDSIFQLKRAWKFASTVIDREATRVRG